LLKNLTHLQNLNVTVLYMKISGTKFVLYFFIYYAHAETTSITAVRRAIIPKHTGRYKTFVFVVANFECRKLF
jgi:hypothetical protein